MTLRELIDHVGDENVLIQNLDSDLESADMNKKKGFGRITFRTAPERVSERAFHSEDRHIGFVLWIPAKLIPAPQREEG